VNRRRVPSALVVVSVLLLGACSGSGSASHRGSSSSTTSTSKGRGLVASDVNPAYAQPGPNVVALTTLKIADRNVEVLYPALKGSERGKSRATYDLRDTLHTPSSTTLPSDSEQRVTLPAYRDLPPAPGPFPVVLFSHDYGSDPLANVSLEADITAWGFVVIAPDHTERDSLAVLQGRASVNDQRDAVVLQTALNAVKASSRLGSIVDLAHVAAVGYAQGAATALAALALPGVDVAVGWASVVPSRPVAAKPVLLVGAQHDLANGSASQRRIYESLSGPRRLVLLGGGTGHATFADQCEDLFTSGQLVVGGDVGSENHLFDLAQNGCFPDEVDPMVAWPAIAHFTVAELRSVFGIDRTPVGLGNGIASAFPDVPLTYEQKP
jgi:predicted dienelactone hydrolase